MDAEHPVISAFQTAAREAPAYQQILAEAGVEAAQVRTLEDFCRQVPVIDKQATFGSFPVAQLSMSMRAGRLRKTV